MVSKFIKDFELEDKERFSFHSMNILARISRQVPEIVSLSGTGSVILYQDHDSDVVGLLLKNTHAENRFFYRYGIKIKLSQLKSMEIGVTTYSFQALADYDSCWRHGIQ